MSLYRWSKEAKLKTGDPWVEVDEAPRVFRDAWMPKGDVPYFDKSARKTFYSRREKREWLKTHGLREGGIIHPNKPLE